MLHIEVALIAASVTPTASAHAGPDLVCGGGGGSGCSCMLLCFPLKLARPVLVWPATCTGSVSFYQLTQIFYLHT